MQSVPLQGTPISFAHLVFPYRVIPISLAYWHSCIEEYPSNLLIGYSSIEELPGQKSSTLPSHLFFILPYNIIISFLDNVSNPQLYGIKLILAILKFYHHSKRDQSLRIWSNSADCSSTHSSTAVMALTANIFSKMCSRFHLT